MRVFDTFLAEKSDFVKLPLPGNLSNDDMTTKNLWFNKLVYCFSTTSVQPGSAQVDSGQFCISTTAGLPASKVCLKLMMCLS